jgi:hypothetical protein
MVNFSDCREGQEIIYHNSGYNDKRLTIIAVDKSDDTIKVKRANGEIFWMNQHMMKNSDFVNEIEQHSPQSSDKLYAFFSTLKTDNTCFCTAPLPCSYHPFGRRNNKP